MATNARRRQIGTIGTAARVVLGLVFLVLGVTAAKCDLGSIHYLSLSGWLGFQPSCWCGSGFALGLPRPVFGQPDR